MTSPIRDENSGLIENYSGTREASVQPSALTKKNTDVLGRSVLVIIVKQQLGKHQNFAGYSQEYTGNHNSSLKMVLGQVFETNHLKQFWLF